MFDVVIHIDGAYYPSKVIGLPNIGDKLELTSYTDMSNHHPHTHNLKVLSITHEIVEFNKDTTKVIKEHHHNINIYCCRS